MTTEDRLRDALAAVTELVQPEQEPGRSAPKLRSPRYAPFAVAAAILLIVTAGVVLGRERAPAPGLLSGGSARYFVAGVSCCDAINELTVRDVQTGRVTATRKPPPDGEWMRASATADPNLFYVLLMSPRGNLPNLYRLRIDEAGRIRALTQVGNLPFTNALAYAVSPDGTRVAFPVWSEGPAEIDVMTLSNGQRTAFRTVAPGRVDALSWAADGRHLAFELHSPVMRRYSIRILDIRAGHNLLASAPVLVTTEAAGLTYTNPVLGADGRSLYLVADHRAKGHRSTQLLELDARTGRRLRVLYEQQYRPSGGNAPWMFRLLARDPGGTGLLVVDNSPGSVHRIDIASGHVTTIPFRRGTPDTVAW